jgi:hypothetical protein
MKYNSIGEYFYKLSNRCLGLILLPMLVVLAIYLVSNYVFNTPNWIAITHLSGGLLITLEVGILAVLMIIQLLLTASSTKRLKREPSLGTRMIGYVPVVMTRSLIFSSMLLVCSGLTFFSGDLNLLYPLPMVAVFLLFYWPTPGRMADDLKLKPEERKIMHNKKMGT